MRLDDFDFDLPEELIAQHPPAQREDARMLALDRTRKTWLDERFINLPQFIRAGDTIVLNNTRVFPARLIGTRTPSGARVELFLIRERDAESHTWEALARPGRRLPPGAQIEFGGGRLRAEIIGIMPDGRRLVRFACEEDFRRTLEEVGSTPLPPYIKREHESAATREEDRERYQTIYARHAGAIAAPTAGLHFTSHIIEEIKNRGVGIVEITLHVGYGTFAPVRAADDLREHRVAAESYAIEQHAAAQINAARARGGRIIAVGTTTTRALEAAAGTTKDAAISAGAGEADLTIIPGHRFRAIDAMITNFHLPRSSLLLLVSAFAGRELVLAAYHHAVEHRYRFYSYGDCMLIY